jgi:hypothetical protein
VGSPARTARRQTHQSDIVIHAFTLHPSGYITQQERSRTRRPRKYGRAPGDAPGRAEIRKPITENRRKSEGRNLKAES